MLVIERKGGGLGWEVVAHPRGDVQDAMRILRELEESELKKRYPGILRLVRVTREVIVP